VNRQETEDDAGVQRGEDSVRTTLVTTRAPDDPTASWTEMPDPFAPAAVSAGAATPLIDSEPKAGSRQRQRRLRLRHSWQQVAGGLILAAACVVAAAWYVPRVLSTDSRLLTGSVVSSGVVTLNFASAGEISGIAVRAGQRVRKGRVLATEYAPDVSSVLSADDAAIIADKTQLAQMRLPKSGATPSEVSAASAHLKLDEAQLATDRVRLASSRIIAPTSGVIIAANGQAGEAVTPSGIRDYASTTARAQQAERPLFSLLPEGPQSGGHVSASASSLPVIALRTSSSWQVAALVSEDDVSKLGSGERVTISVPAARIGRVPGRISEVLSDPVSTPQGDEYQALVTVVGHVARLPLSGMAADVQLETPGQ
jgi:multidrug efflux pump subunit AcrA (membrane-fusion protein)